MKRLADFTKGVGDITESRQRVTTLSDVLEIDVVAEASPRPQLPSSLHSGATIGSRRRECGVHCSEALTRIYHR